MATRTSHGVYVGNDPALLNSFNDFIGKPAGHVLSYFNDRSWSQFDSSIGWATDLWKPSGAPMVWGVPLTVVGTPLEEVATGAHNDTFLKAAQALATQSQPFPDGNIYVRVGWEYNGDWMPWAAQGHEQGFIDAYHQLVDTFRSVSDKFKFVWDVSVFESNYDPAKAYPGDNYVDVVGLDVYWDKRWDSSDPKAAFETKLTQPVGLQWVADFAAAHGKPMAVSEWGVQDDDGAPFIAAMDAWMEQNKVIMDNYWQTDLADFNGDLRDHPVLADAYRNAFSNDTQATPPTDTAPPEATPTPETPAAVPQQPATDPAASDPVTATPTAQAPADASPDDPATATPPASPQQTGAPDQPRTERCWHGHAEADRSHAAQASDAAAVDMIRLLLGRADGSDFEVMAQAEFRLRGDHWQPAAFVSSGDQGGMAQTGFRGFTRESPGHSAEHRHGHANGMCGLDAPAAENASIQDGQQPDILARIFAHQDHHPV